MQVHSTVLNRVLAQRGIIAGIDHRKLGQAASPTPQDRLLTVAKRRPNRDADDLLGRPFPPAGPRIEITSNGLAAVLVLPQGCSPGREELASLLKEHGIRRGLDKEALADVLNAQANRERAITIARGKPPETGPVGRFRLRGPSRGERPLAMTMVREGDTVATWHMPGGGLSGWTVTGSTLPPQRPVDSDPESMAGPGTEIRGTPPGPCTIIAACDGTCYQRPDGTVLVVDATEMGRAELEAVGQVQTNDVLVIDGGVGDGCTIVATSDLVVRGDVGNSRLTVGGNLLVEGSVLGGDQPITVAGEAQFANCRQRRLMVGALMCPGLAEDAFITAVMDVEVGHAVGGQLTAGRQLRLQRAGDDSGRTTRLWAGHSLGERECQHLAKVRLAGTVRERRLAVEDLTAVAAYVDDCLRKLARLRQSDIADPKAVKRLGKRFNQLRNRADRLEEQVETMRLDIKDQRSDQLKAARQLQEEHGDARILVSEQARHGVESRLANYEAERVRKTRRMYLRTLSQVLIQARQQGDIDDDGVGEDTVDDSISPEELAQELDRARHQGGGKADQ
jgi:uncharacterized protein (DUF342 family)